MASPSKKNGRLVMTFKRYKDITINTPTGDTITVCLVDPTATQARIAITAPKEYLIVRNDKDSQNGHPPEANEVAGSPSASQEDAEQTVASTHETNLSYLRGRYWTQDGRPRTITP